MSWNYTDAPSTDTADGRRDAVRLLVGDTDTNDQQLTDAEILFYLAEAADRTYFAASSAAKGIGAKLSRFVSNSMEGVSVTLSDRIAHYEGLSRALMTEAKRQGVGLGLPSAGGVSIAAAVVADSNADRPDPAFRTGEFRNPPRFTDTDTDY